MFTQASLRYLSPFQNIIRMTPFQFENSTSNVIQKSFFRIFTRTIESRQNPCYHQPSPRMISVTSAEIRSIADDLIRLYFEQINPKLPLLHKPTFLRHYQSLEDPLSCPITLAICVNTVSCNRQVLNYNASERRQLGEVYYNKCKEILANIFDDPKKKLETIFTITFLHHFIIFGLVRPAEGRRLATISYLLCKEVEPSIATNNGSPLSILFKRHYYHLQHVLCLLDDIIDQSTSRPYPSISQLEKIVDEDQVTCAYIDTYNHMLRLSQHPCLKGMTVWTFTRDTNARMFSLERIIESDRTISEWWSSLPSNLRIRDDYYAEDIDKAVSGCKSMAAVMMFAYLHANIIQVHTCLIMPRPSSDDAQSSDEILNQVRNKALSTVLRSCDLVLSAVTNIVTSSELDIPVFTFQFIARVIHAFISVSKCPKSKVPASLQHKFYCCVQSMRAQMPSDNQIPPSISPINTYLSTSHLGDVTVYRRYPFPGIALIEDILATFHEQLQASFTNNDDSPSPDFVNFTLSDNFIQ
ncbi:hypothetical protein BJV82DRAFT_187955 [Fennellomyces sp. T-0311]|nr:hypothetical protein BJV82DRAFT_187955 [Fennellomyces sp. T-0311]